MWGGEIDINPLPLLLEFAFVNFFENRGGGLPARRNVVCVVCRFRLRVVALRDAPFDVVAENLLEVFDVDSLAKRGKTIPARHR